MVCAFFGLGSACSGLDASTPEVGRASADEARDADQAVKAVESEDLAQPAAANAGQSNESAAAAPPIDDTSNDVDDELEPSADQALTDDTSAEPPSIEASCTAQGGGFDFYPLNDAEDGDAWVSNTGGVFDGYWYTLDDTNECDNVAPVEVTSPMPVPSGGAELAMTRYSSLGVSPPPDCSESANEYTARIWGGGQTLWGAGLGLSLSLEDGQMRPVDLDDRGVTALTFWARSSVGPPTLEVQITDAYSEPDAGLCPPRDELTYSTQGCFDSASYRTDIGDEWTLLSIPLTNFMRGRWGSHYDGVSVPDGLESAQAYQLRFMVPVVDASTS